MLKQAQIHTLIMIAFGLTKLGIAPLNAQSRPLGQAYQLTHSINVDPSFSRDGKRMVFISVIADREQLFTRLGCPSADPGGRSYHSPSWSPDESRVAYCTDDDLKPPHKNLAQIYGIEVATGRLTQLIAGGVNTYPSGRPTGNGSRFEECWAR